MSIKEIAARVDSEITGRIAGGAAYLYPLLETVEMAGDGNYCEIGVLHGGSLCAVALLKKELGHKGICYGIDPFDGYYPGKTFHKKVDPISKVSVTLDTVNENIKKFGLDNVKIIQALSNPFPIKEKFAVTYIDGDHWDGAPQKDWMNVKKITSRFVIFDNCDLDHLDVIEACNVANRDKKWNLYKQAGAVYIFEREKQYA